MRQEWLDWAEGKAPIDEAEAVQMLAHLMQAFTDAPIEAVIPITTRIRTLPEIFTMIREVESEGGLSAGSRAYFEEAPNDKRMEFVRLMNALLPDEPNDTPEPGM